ncbi:UNVERIFIED_CONTAM: hypothetical protein Slati_1979100 [Sesamum latifolium]|uniref:Programmed cell death protein 5 n=1 Tax=Sesamum latifolium TaxID=2727402 RepID=A0AAW2WKX2_9LAMI
MHDSHGVEKSGKCAQPARADPELEAIRQRRMQELMGKSGMGNNQKSEQQKAQEEAKRFIALASILFVQLLESHWLNLKRPEELRMLIRAAQMGQIVDQVSEERLISLLEQINTQTTKETKVTIKRRQSVLDDD